MFDFLNPIGDFFATIAQWIGYGLIASFIVGALFLLVAVPVMVKVAAVAVARTAIVETARLLSESGIASSFNRATDSVTRAANELTNEIRKQNQSRAKFEIIQVEDVEVR